MDTGEDAKADVPHTIKEGVLAPPPVNARNMAPAYSNIVKKFNNMNYCFSCGFVVEDWHTSKTCRYEKRRVNHQEVADCSIAQQYIKAGYNACTKANHKSILPSVF